MKKAQGLSLQTVIIAILLLVVLAILIYIFSSKIGGIDSSLDSCEGQGGKCNQASCFGPTIKAEDCEDCCVALIKEKTN